MTDRADAELVRDADVVEIRMPAHSAYLSVLRTTAATLAARLDFTLDDVEDLRIAVTEASTILLGHAVSDSEISCRFTLSGTMLTVRAGCVLTSDSSAADHESTSVIRRDSFAWTVLTALVDSVDITPVSSGHAGIELVKTATTAHAHAGDRPALRAVPPVESLDGETRSDTTWAAEHNPETDPQGHDSPE